MASEHEALMASNYQIEQAGIDSRLMRDHEPLRPDHFFISAHTLKKALDQKMDSLVVLDVTRGKGNYQLDQTRVASDYAKGHIPGATHFNTDELGEFKDYLLEPDLLKERFLAKGITKDTLLVVYSIYARDILYIASRVAFAAYYLGVDHVKILDGGLQAWQRAGFELEYGEKLDKAVQDFGCDVPKRPEIYIKTPEDLLNYREEHPKAILASVRTWKEYLGVNEGHAWNKGVGEIAGARYLGDERLANIQGYIANSDIYQPQWEQWGLTRDREIVLYCGTSWRSSTAFFVMKQLGYKHLAMFDGSWFKWYQAHLENPKRFPIQRGNPMGQPPLELIDF